MNSQNTPVHIRLWHRDFWLMAIANLLLTSSVYMLVPTMPKWLLDTQGLSPLETGLSMGTFGVGLFVFGAFVSFLVQHYRRNIVCIWAVLAMAGLLGLLYYLDAQRCEFVEFWLVMLQRFGLGAVFGLAQMVLTSTLIIDTSESYQRTEANHAAAWFGRFALSLGPLA
ncbi:MAG: MFS transporter, partial [Prevotella sp.]|nr:MFS transporter [Prevotella sp.]